MTRLLIANDIDENLFRRNDTRGWCQRIFWFAEPGDVVVVPEAPDEDFTAHVGRVRGLDFGEVRVSVAPPGRYAGKMIDMRALCAPEYMTSLRELVPPGVEEVFLLFPSLDTHRVTSALGGSVSVAGAEFFRQGGANTANSKAVFRSLAVPDIPVADGEVCFVPEDAVGAIRELVDGGRRALVKRVQGGAGVGNELVASGGSLPLNVGVLTARTVSEEDGDGVEAYVGERWAWASMDGRYPVVVEEFLDVSASFCVEFLVGDAGVRLLGPSTLEFEHNRIVREVIGSLPLAVEQSAEFLAAGEVLAERYRQIGYRGFVCFDAVLTGSGRICFTEANARTATGTHLNVAFASVLGERRVVQLNSDPAWGRLSTSEFLALLDKHDLTYSSETGLGIAMMTPPVSNRLEAGFLYMIASADPADEAACREKLLAVVPALEKEDR